MELENDRMKSVTKGLTRYFAKRGSGAKPPDFIKLKKIALQGKQKTEKKVGRSAGRVYLVFCKTGISVKAVIGA
jgi:hypothetical protein